MISPRDLGPNFEGLPAVVLERIASLAVPSRYRPRQVLFRAGDPADGLYIVISGRVRVSRETANHVELLHTEMAGGVLGEIPVFGGVPFPATAVATEATRCAKLPRDAVERLLREHSEFARFAIRRLASRAQTLIRRIDELTTRTIVTRLADHLSQRIAADGAVSLGMSQGALAEELGTAREVVVRALAALVAANALRRVGRSRFVVVDRSVLRSIAGR